MPNAHAALGLGLAACQQGLSVRFVTAAALVHELMEARDERRLLRLQKQLANHRLLIIDELGFVPLSKTGAELLFELVSQRYERAATLITSNLPFDEWDRDVRLGAPDRGAARPPYPSCPYPRNERRKFSPQSQPRAENGPRGLITTPSSAGNSGRATPSLRFRLPPPQAQSRPPRTTSPPPAAVAVFCSALWSGFSPPLTAGAKCSMDGRGRCLDNVFIERLWRSLKYEAVYLHELCDGFEAERVIANWMRFYTEERPHSALGGRTPSEAYRWERAA